VIDLINGLSIGVQASINATGDGIAIVDTASGWPDERAGVVASWVKNWHGKQLRSFGI